MNLKAAAICYHFARLQEHQAQAVFNQTEDYVMFPDEATTSLCVWDSRNASRKQLLSLGHNGPVLEMPSCHMLNASSSQFHNHFKVKMNSILQPPHFSQRCAGWSTRPPMPPSSPAATTSEPDSGTGGTDLHMKTFSRRGNRGTLIFMPMICGHLDLKSTLCI